MKASEWIPTLPETSGQAREDMVYDAATTGSAIVTFTPLLIRQDGHELRIDVATDAIQIGEVGDSVRVATNALTATLIADSLNCLLPTARICDLIWLGVLGGGGVVLTPHTQTPDSHMSDTDRFVAESDSIEEQRAGRCGLLFTVGKSFVISNRIFGAGEGKAANYGWHVQSGSQFSGVTPGVQVLQPLAASHVDTFTDYSQLLTGFVRRECFLNGSRADLADILQDAELADIVSSEGALLGYRYPNAGGDGPPSSVPDPEPTDPSSFPVPPEQWRSPLKRGMKGPDVGSWQQALLDRGYDLAPYGADQDFGGLTESRTRQFQSAQQPPLVSDGIVGPATRAALEGGHETIPSPPPEPEDGELDLGVPFLQARNYTPADRDHLDTITLHTMQAVEKPGTALAVCRWFASATAPQASTHLNCDCDEAWESVKPSDVAWGAKGNNSRSYHIEHAGYHYQSEADWDDDYSRRMLQLSAKYARMVADHFDIPVVKLSPEQLAAGERGFVGHHDVTLAFSVPGGHVDPGPNFPWDHYLSLVRGEE